MVVRDRPAHYEALRHNHEPGDAEKPAFEPGQPRKRMGGKVHTRKLHPLRRRRSAHLGRACARFAMDRWSFLGAHSAAPVRKQRAANLALHAVTPARRAVPAPIKNNPQVQRVPVITRKKLFQVSLRLLDAAPVAQAPALREPVDVCVDWKRRHAPRLCHHHARGLVADARQGLEFGERPRHRAAVPLDQEARQRGDILRFRRCQPARPDDRVDCLDGHARHFLRSVSEREQRRRDFVHALVGALRGQHHGHEQRKRVAMHERHRRRGIKLRESAIDPSGTLGFGHAATTEPL